MSARVLRRAAYSAIALASAWWALAAAAPAAGGDSAALAARWRAANPQARLDRSFGAAPSPPAHLHALAVRELSSGYRLRPVAAPAPQRPWWLRAGQWLMDRWNDLWRAAFGRARLGRRGAVAIGDVLLIAAVAAIAFAVWRLLGALLLERSPAPDGEALPHENDPAALYAAAMQRARAGEFALASRLLFAATIGRLARLGVLPEDRSATVGDLRRAVRRCDAALLPPFDAVSAAFVTGAYAELPVDAPMWERALHAYRALDGGEPA